jgi:hypothetical protein
MRKSLLKWGVGFHKTEVRPIETPSPFPLSSSPRTILIDLPAEYVDGFVETQDDVVLSVDPSIAALLANPSCLQDVVGKSTTHFALCCLGGDRSAISAFSDMASGGRDRCCTPSAVNGKQIGWTAFKSKERLNCFMLLATVREYQERAALGLDQRVLDKDINLRLEAEHAVQRQRIDKLEKEKNRLEADSKVIEERNLWLEAEQVVQIKWIDELEKEYVQARRNNPFEQEKTRLESDLLEERNQRLEAESNVVEERNLRLEAEQVVHSKLIDELEKEKEQARINDLLEQEKRGLESDLLKERNQRLEAEIYADSHLNHTLKVCT